MISLRYCAGVHGQGHHTGEETVEGDEAEDLEGGEFKELAEHAKVDHHHLHQHRGGADDLYIGSGQEGQGLNRPRW